MLTHKLLGFLLLTLFARANHLSTLHTALAPFVEPHTPAHNIHKVIDYKCCQRFGGVVCGMQFPECCTLGCAPGTIGGVTCLGEKIRINPHICPNSCKNKCERRGGMICGTSILTEQCCYAQYCSGIFYRTCEQGMQIPLGRCMPSTAFARWRT